MALACKVYYESTVRVITNLVLQKRISYCA